MANSEHLAILEQGVDAWNKWRADYPGFAPDLRGANLGERDLKGVNFASANLDAAYFSCANLSKADLTKAYAAGTIFQGATLSEAILDGEFSSGFFHQTVLRNAKAMGGNFERADFEGADARGADFTGATLVNTRFYETNLTDATFDRCWVHGVSVWRVVLDGAFQSELKVTRHDEPTISVDNIELANFIYLLLGNEKIKGVLDTVTSKVVLLLGRFSKDGKAVLDGLREELRRRDYVPVIFDFEKPVDKAVADTVTTLAKLAHFVIADVTDARWVTVETQRIVREAPSVPFRLIKHEAASVPSPITDLRAEFEPPLIKPFSYKSLDHAVASVEEIVKPAEDMAAMIRAKRKAIEDDPW